MKEKEGNEEEGGEGWRRTRKKEEEAEGGGAMASGDSGRCGRFVLLLISISVSFL